jgi:hypothetical protein
VKKGIFYVLYSSKYVSFTFRPSQTHTHAHTHTESLEPTQTQTCRVLNRGWPREHVENEKVEFIPETESMKK